MGRCAAERRMLSTLVGSDVVAGRERSRRLPDRGLRPDDRWSVSPTL